MEKFWEPTPEQLAELDRIEQVFVPVHGPVETKHLASLIRHEMKMTVRVYGKKVFFPKPWHKEADKVEAQKAYAKRMIRLRRLLEIIEPKQTNLFES